MHRIALCTFCIFGYFIFIFHLNTFFGYLAVFANLTFLVLSHTHSNNLQYTVYHIYPIYPSQQPILCMESHLYILHVFIYDHCNHFCFVYFRYLCIFGFVYFLNYYCFYVLFYFSIITFFRIAKLVFNANHLKKCTNTFHVNVMYLPK